MDLQHCRRSTDSKDAGDYCAHGTYWREDCKKCQDECDNTTGHRPRWLGNAYRCVLCNERVWTI